MSAAQAQGRAPFPYYSRLSAHDKRVYERSDAIGEIPLPEPGRLRPLVGEVHDALLHSDRIALERAASALALGLAEAMGVPSVGLEVLAVRPRSGWGELHGLYTRDDGHPPRIRLWMRTAKHRRVVAFRTFLRTLLHEVCHHLDYAHFKLADSFHTDGFFRRESSLFRQLVPSEADSPIRPGP
jgi:hypothetical protein